MQNSESGRKLNQAVNNTSRAVGGAISTAKGAFSTWWTSFTAPVPMAAAAVDQPVSPSTQSSNAQSNSNNNNGDGQCSESSDCDDDPDQDSSYSDSDRSQSNGNKTSPPPPPLSPSSQIATAKVTAEKTNNIIEIGKEAELLDRRPKIIDI